MATAQQTEQAYSGHESVGVAVFVGCGMLSLICVLSMFVILGVSVVQSRRSSDNTLFVRTHVAKYFASLLICNLVQTIGGLINIAWIVENRVYVGAACTTQAVTKQIGNCGAAIFSFVIATHTFSLLFLRRQWSDRTCYIVLTISWASLLLELCIENFVLANSNEGPYYGIAGYWCWITSAYPIEQYATSYLLMFTSAALSFILHFLVFFRLRGNIIISPGYKISFQRRPRVRLGRTSDGAYIATDDQRVESHLTKVAKHMLWYPFAYTILVLPIAASRYSAFSGAPVPFAVTIATAAVFILHGFVNTLLFCTTRNILPGSWRQRLGLGTNWDSTGADVGPSGRSNPTWQFTGYSTARIGTISKGMSSIVISNIAVEKTVEILYDDDQPSPSYLRFGSPSSHPSPTSPTPLLRAYSGGGQLVDTHRGHTRHLSSFLTSRDVSSNIRTGVDEDDGDSDFSAGIDPGLKAETVESGAPPRPSFSGQESDLHCPTSGLQAPASIHLFSTTQPMIDADKRQTHSLPTLTSPTTVNAGQLSGAS